MNVTINCTEKELYLIASCLEFYTRVGIGQMNAICNHPSFEKIIEGLCTPNRSPIVGDSTPQGKVLEISNGKCLINGSVKNGKWCKDKEWKKIKDVKISPDYSLYHKIMMTLVNELSAARDKAFNKNIGASGNFGIFNKQVDDSCRIAYHLKQEINHELWKNQDNKLNYSISSYAPDTCHIAGIPIPNFKIEINERR